MSWQILFIVSGFVLTGIIFVQSVNKIKKLTIFQKFIYFLIVEFCLYFFSYIVLTSGII